MQQRLILAAAMALLSVAMRTRSTRMKRTRPTGDRCGTSPPPSERLRRLGKIRETKRAETSTATRRPLVVTGEI